MAQTSDALSPAAAAGVRFREEAARGSAGYFRAAPDADGRWWLVDPEGQPFFCRAVHGVRASPPTPDGGTGPGDAAARLRAWGFNAVGLGGDGSVQEDGLPDLASAELGRAGAAIRAPGVWLPDVFAPDWAALAEAQAQAVCRPRAGDRQLIGWVADERTEWGRPRAGRPTLLQVCLSLEPGFAAYHAAWEFTLALHGGRLDAVGRAWGVPLANKAVVREHTRVEHGLATRGYLRDDARWAREFARRYFATTAHAIRAADPHHLVLGGRGAGPADGPVRGEAVFPAVDVVLADWREPPAAGPAIADDFGWADEEFYGGPAPARGLGLTAVERMLRRGRGAFERMARHPALAGYVWRQWLDEAGEQPPFARGLVHVNGAGAREHTELLTALNGRAESVRRAVRPAMPARSFSFP